jgi:prepilin-type N-terminal cleavage/methylation domain-containing protein
MTGTRARRSLESGMTLVELMVVLTVLSLVLLSLYGILNSLSNNASRQQALVINQETVRLATVQIARDLRGANPLEPLFSGSLYPTQFDAAILPVSGSTPIYVRWKLTGTTLTRSILDGAGGNVVSTNNVVTNVTNATIGTTLFRYFSSSRDELLFSASPPSNPPDNVQYVTAGTFATCTVRVHIALVAAPQPGPASFVEETDAEIRNRLPGGIGC